LAGATGVIARHHLMFTSAKAKSRPRPRFIAWSIQTIANGSSRRAFFNGPASTGSKPSLPTSCITPRFRPPAAALHRWVDPDHSERLQQAGVLQRAGVNWLETELTYELHHSRFPAGIV